MEDIIDAAEDREIKIAIAVKMVILGFKKTSVIYWKYLICLSANGKRFMNMKALMDYGCITRAAAKFLADAQCCEICCHFRDQPHDSVEALMGWIER